MDQVKLNDILDRYVNAEVDLRDAQKYGGNTNLLGSKVNEIEDELIQFIEDYKNETTIPAADARSS